MPLFLLTRPKAQNARFAAELVARLGAGVRWVDSPLLQIVYLDPALPDLVTQGNAAIIFTSENAVAAFQRSGADPHRVAWCVGKRTARAASEAGFDARSANGDAEALLALLMRERPTGGLVHFRGTEARGRVALRLNSAGIETQELVVYDQAPVPPTAPALAALLGNEPVIAPLFSPRTARLFREAVALLPAHAPLLVAAMSQAVADDLTGLRVQRVEIAVSPDADAMLDATAKLCAAVQQP